MRQSRHRKGHTNWGISNGDGDQRSDLLNQTAGGPGLGSSQEQEVPFHQLALALHHHCLQSAHVRVENEAIKGND